MTQLVFSRKDRHVDWGAQRRVLVFAAKTGYYLCIVEGHYESTYGAPGFGRSYVPARLSLYGPREERVGRFDSHTLHEGRVSRKIIRENATLIDDVFGPGTADKIVPSATLYLP